MCRHGSVLLCSFGASSCRLRSLVTGMCRLVFSQWRLLCVTRNHPAPPRCTSCPPPALAPSRVRVCARVCVSVSVSVYVYVYVWVCVCCALTA